MPPELSQIIVYPIKSLDGVPLSEARITTGGILEYDRIYALVDENGHYVNGKRTPLVHQLRSTYDPSFQEVGLRRPDSTQFEFFPLSEPKQLNQWLTDHFEFTVKIVTEAKSGFPDDRSAPGPTINSEASLELITSWFPGLTKESARRRFRSNLGINHAPPFWEDNLFGAAHELKPFRIGEVSFQGHNPCQRCVVPTRDPDSSEPVPNFQKNFMELRQQQLPAWSNPQRFNHYYRFAINTSIPASEAGKQLRIGDLVLF